MKRAPVASSESGIALITTLMVLMLASSLMIGFFAAITADQRANGLDRDQTKAYAAAHAGLEKLTSDLASLFAADVSPSGAQIAALTTRPPVLPGFQYTAPGGNTGSGYAITFLADANGNPVAENGGAGTSITAGPYQGFKGLITKYPITVTARSAGGLKSGCAASSRRWRCRCFSSASSPRRISRSTPVTTSPSAAACTPTATCSCRS